ncbi:MAG: DNA-directed RNA polymerase subunit alpha [Candidatus Magasanikbacteria bacterium]
MENIFHPMSIDFVDTDNQNLGHVVISPCNKGYGTTLGNALRRVLLSSLPGAAIESMKITGVQHEFSAVEGVKEDAIEIILNLKQVAIKLHGEGPVTLSLSKKGIGPVTAGDFEKNADVEIMNPEMVLAHITEEKKPFDMEVIVGKGYGYVPVAEKDTKNLDLGTIAIDSIYTPIRDVGYEVENTRVGDVTDFEKLTLRVETNGTINPKEAVKHASKILVDHFTAVIEAAGDNSETEA